MNSFRNNKRIVLILLIMLVLSLSLQLAFASENVTEVEQSSESNGLKVSNDVVSEKISNEDSSQNYTNIFIISDNPGVNIIDAAASELQDENYLNHVNLVVRSGDQVKTMGEAELIGYLSDCDVFIGEWISSDVDSVLTSVLTKYPELSNKEIFLILEPPSGNLNSESSSINLLKNNTLNYNKIFSTYGNEELISYFKNTNPFFLIFVGYLNGNIFISEDITISKSNFVGDAHEKITRLG